MLIVYSNTYSNTRQVLFHECRGVEITFKLEGLVTKVGISNLKITDNTLTDLRLPKNSSKTCQKCFSFRVAKAWNVLSAEGKLTSSLASFKKFCIAYINHFIS